MKSEPPLDAKCRDKFLVQSVAVTADKEFADIASIVGSPQRRYLECLLTSRSGRTWAMRRNRPSRRRRYASLSFRQTDPQVLLRPEEVLVRFPMEAA